MITKKINRNWLTIAGLNCLLGINCLSITGQEFTIHSGGLSLESGTLSLNETSVTNHARIYTQSGTLLSFSGTNELFINGSEEITLHNLKISTDFRLENALLVEDTINLTSGLFNLSDFPIYLSGFLMGENENARITADGSGEIINTSTLLANQENNPGNMGILINSDSEVSAVEIRRGHMPGENLSSSSIRRYYSLDPIPEEYSITFSYLEAELDGISENELQLFGEVNGIWELIINSSLDKESNRIYASLGKPYSKLTLFPGDIPDITVPKGFSPNGDGINDQLIIIGAENFPNNKLTIFNQWGEMIFEASPYNNDWEGESEFRLSSQTDKKLFDGTYFYIFYKDLNDKESAVKGFFELKSNMD